MKINRIAFIKKTLAATILAVSAYALISCSNDDSTDADPVEDPEASDCLVTGANATVISSNHGHTLSVSKADIDAGIQKIYFV